MPGKLPILSGEKMIKILKKEGFYFVKQKGSHLKLKKESNRRELIVTIPKHKELKKGVILNILRQAELTREEFLKLI